MGLLQFEKKTSKVANILMAENVENFLQLAFNPLKNGISQNSSTQDLAVIPNFDTKPDKMNSNDAHREKRRQMR